MAGTDLDGRQPREAALNGLAAEAWMARCACRLRALNPDSPLDGTGWEDVAGHLFEAAPNLEPEWVAATFIALTAT